MLSCTSKTISRLSIRYSPFGLHNRFGMGFVRENSTFSKASLMQSLQSQLPRIPVPDLRETLDKYLIAAQPLVSEKQLAQTRKYVEDFMTKPEWGPFLQSQVQALDSQSPTSYIEGFWDSMYLEIRDPIVTNVNPAFMIANVPETENAIAQATHLPLQLARAAQLLHTTAKFVLQIRTGTLPPDMDKKTPLDMTQYTKLFCSTRIPGYNRDSMKISESNARYVLVIIHGQYYTLDILDTSGQHALSISEIGAQLLNIRNKAYELRYQGGHYPIGALTAEERVAWYYDYHALTPLNRASLSTIEDSILAVCLDDEAPPTIADAGRSVLHSLSADNRYYDKSLQLVIFSNGLTGINFEHTGFDGHTVLRYAEFLHTFNYADVLKDITPVLTENTSTLIYSEQTESKLHNKNVMKEKSAQQVVIDVPKKLLSHLSGARQDATDLSTSLHVHPYTHAGFGSKFARQAGYSPDALVQVAFQLAHFRAFGHIVSTYESSNVKHYLAGRTETVRGSTSEALAFVKTFTKDVVSSTAAGASNSALTTSMKLLKDAVDRHSSIMKDSKAGKRIDRHLQVLNWLSLQQFQRQANYVRPTLFTDPTYATYMTSELSTSNCTSPALTYFAFGPVTSTGIGIGYSISENNVAIQVSSFEKSKADKFVTEFENALLDLTKAIQANQQPL